MRHPLKTRSKLRTRQQGVTLLESLVSILILAVAVLGMLGVQLRTLAETQVGVRRGQAVRLIEDLAERVKANPGGFTQLANYRSDWNDAPGTNPCPTSACTPDQLAALDVMQWKAAVANVLPEGKAAIFMAADEEAGQKRQLGVMVGWHVNERRTENMTDANYTQYLAPLQVPTAEAGTVACPDNFVCHLVYVQP